MPVIRHGSGAARAVSAVSLVLCGLLAAAPPAFPQQPQPSGYFTLPHRSASQVDPADAALLRADRRSLAAEAAFFGYDLNAPGWVQDQILCPAMPGYRMLQYRRPSRRGLSLFSALVPRDAGRVSVVPILYAGATPFGSAVGSQRSLGVFNRAVAPPAAQRALQPDGEWLALAACYAALDGAEPFIPEDAAADPVLVRAPTPTFQISELNGSRTVLFTDRDAPGHYRVWTIVFNAQGHVVSAAAQSVSDFVARPLNPVAPREKAIQPGAEPKTIPLPAPAQPKEVPTPQ